eukprot:6896710-Prorocentrum_lima.AAC.1
MSCMSRSANTEWDPHYACPTLPMRAWGSSPCGTSRWTTIASSSERPAARAKQPTDSPVAPPSSHLQ